jgi:dihydroorotate dehydrogenase
MIDLSTNYLGLKLKNPVVVSASPLTEKLENFARLEDAGAAAIVMYSLMEEQIEAESANIDNALEYGTNSYAESTSYFPDMQKYHVGPDRYLELLHKGKQSVSIPVIGSLNGRSPGGWVRYAEYMEQAGADALELNIFDIPTDPSLTADDLETRYCNLVRTIRKSVRIPIAVKLGPYFTSCANFVKRLSEAGADGVVIFNRFYQPDFDLEELEVTPEPGPQQPARAAPPAALGRDSLSSGRDLHRHHRRRPRLNRRAEVHDGGRACHDDDLGAAEVRHRAHRRGAGRHGTLDGRARVRLGAPDARQHEHGQRREPGGLPARQLHQDARVLYLARAGHGVEHVLD